MTDRMKQGLRALTLLAVVAVALAILLGFNPGDGARDLPQAMAVATSVADPAGDLADHKAGEIGSGDDSAAAEDGEPSSFEDLQKLLEADPTNADLWRDLGANFVTAHEYVSAAEAFAAAVELRPDDARLHSDLATALLYQGLVRVARAEYERALALDPELPEAHFNLGITYSHSAPFEVDRALVAWQRAIEYSDDPELTELAQQYILAYEGAQSDGAAPGAGSTAGADAGASAAQDSRGTSPLPSSDQDDEESE